MRKEVEKLCQEFITTNPKGRSLICSVSGTHGNVKISYQGKIVRPAGSLAKLAIALALGQALLDGNLRQDQTVAVKELNTSENPSIWNNFKPKRELTLTEIANIMLSMSDNTSADYLFHLLGSHWINEVMQNHGLKGTQILTGFSDTLLNEEAGVNCITAEDSLELLRILTDEQVLFGQLFHKALSNGIYRNRIGLHLPWKTTLANKTATNPALGLVSDIAIYHGQSSIFEFAFICQDEYNANAITSASLEIGDLVKQVALLCKEQVKKTSN